MQLQVSFLAFVVCVSLISAGRHRSHRGECNHRGYDDDNDLDAIPAGGYEPDEQPYSTGSQIHRQRQQTHSSFFQHDTPFLKTGITSARKPYYKNNGAYGYQEEQQSPVVPYQEDQGYDQGYEKAENDATNRKWSSSNGYSNLWSYLLKSKQKMKMRKKPWLLLPNHASCYQEFCKSDKDCCRHYNICDKSARVCIDCWYGYPCASSADCCERYPECQKEYGESHGRCSKK